MKLFFYVLFMPIFVFAETGAFLEWGKGQKERANKFPQEIDVQGQCYGFGYIYEFYDLIGTGIYGSWSSNTVNKKIFDQLLKVDEYAAHFLVSPVTLTHGYFRVLSYSGIVRFYSFYNFPKERELVFRVLSVYGFGIELPFLFQLKFAISYSKN